MHRARAGMRHVEGDVVQEDEHVVHTEPHPSPTNAE